MKEGYSETKCTEGTAFSSIPLLYPAVATCWSCECGYNLIKRFGPYVDRGDVPAEEWTKIYVDKK